VCRLAQSKTSATCAAHPVHQTAPHRICERGDPARTWSLSSISRPATLSIDDSIVAAAWPPPPAVLAREPLHRGASAAHRVDRAGLVGAEQRLVGALSRPPPAQLFGFWALRAEQAI
jgi:hypothetical protein